MKVINVLLIVLVLCAAIGLTMIAIDGNALFGATGLALLYFLGAAGYFLNCHTFKRMK